MKEEDFIKFYNEYYLQNVSSMEEIQLAEYGPYTLLDFVEQAIQHQKILDEIRTGNIRLPETIIDYETKDGWPCSSKSLALEQSSKKPHYCPVCGGKGKLPNGFYGFAETTSEFIPENCRSCNGKGVIWG